MVKRMCAAVVVAWGMLMGGHASAATPEQIQGAIGRGVKYLYSVESGGTWDAPVGMPVKAEDDTHLVTSGQYGGLTALSTYALLSAGEDPKDPRLASAIRFLEKTDMRGVYALGIRCLVWHSLPDGESDPGIRAAMVRDLTLLEKGVHQDTSMYNYLVDYPESLAKKQAPYYDHSVSQYGVLGMWALQESGMEVPSSYWKAIDAAWRKEQLADGGWDYHRGWNLPKYRAKRPEDYVSRPSMTEAGIATLFLAQDELLMGLQPGPCHGDVRDTAIDRGLDWMAAHLESVFSEKSPYYTLYGLERIGAASGRVYFKNVNWFDRGADYLVKNQGADGDWGTSTSNTAFGILFWRAGAPVTMNKLQYYNDVGGKPEEGDWNERPRDIASFNPWLGGQVEFPHVLNWQVLSLDASAADLHSAPVLLVTGDRALNFSPADRQKLKKFIDQGGLVLFNADCGSPAFTDSVIHLGTALYPLAEFSPLTKDDAIFSHEQFRPGNPLPKVLGLSNGIRELMVLIPDVDVTRAWQGGRTIGRRAEYELGANILMYACDKTGILHKGESYVVQNQGGAALARRVKVARIQYNGNWDPEPEGWPRLAAIMHNSGQADLAIDAITAGAGKLAGHDVAVLTGTGVPHIEHAGWDEIKDFVQNGGTLIVDAAGGSPNSTFASAVHDELAAIFPDQAKALESPLAFSDPFYTKSQPAMTEVYFRPYSRTVQTDMSSPQVRAMKFGNRIGVFFSGEDLTEGLVGQHLDGVVGYQPESASILMEKMVLSSGGQ